MDEEPTPVLAELVEIVHQLEQAITIPLRLAQLEASSLQEVLDAARRDNVRLLDENTDLKQMWDASRHRKRLSEYRKGKYEAVDAAEALRVKYNGLKVALEQLHRRDDSGEHRVCAHCRKMWPCETALQMIMHLGPTPSLDELDVIDD